MNNRKTFFKFVIPSVLAFALSGVYTIVDGFFIGQSLGDIGLASIVLGYPITAIIQALGTGLGMSGAIRFTIMKAQGSEKEQQSCFGGTTLLMFLLGGLITALLFIFLYPLLHLLGAEGKILTITAEYIRVIAFGTLLQLLATGLVPFIRNMGGSTFAMIAMIAGFLTNICLDYFFVWIFDWGMAGAALATVIGQAVTMLAAVLFFIRKKAAFHLPQFAAIPAFFCSICKVAVAPFGLTISPTITIILMNRFLLMHGNEQAVAVYSCISYVVSIVYLLLQGVGDGSQPLISKYYGKGNIREMVNIRRFAYETAFVITIVCMAGLFVVRGSVGVLFGASSDACREVADYLPVFLAPLLFLSYVRVTTSYFYATEKAILSYFLVFAEPLFEFILLLFLPLMLNLLGVWLAVPISQAIACLIAVCAQCAVEHKLVLRKGGE